MRWAFDLPMQPSLIDFTKADGGKVPAVVIGTKASQIYVLDRNTGQPLTKVEEVPVKAANIPNEPYSLTQPKSVGMPMGSQSGPMTYVSPKTGKQYVVITAGRCRRLPPP
ncbi:glucose dehydrogenase [Pseudomonas sp. HLS-6 TE3448]